MSINDDEKMGRETDDITETFSDCFAVDEISEIRGPPAISVAQELGTYLEKLIPDAQDCNVVLGESDLELFTLEDVEPLSLLAPCILESYGPNDRDELLKYLRLELLKVAAGKGHIYAICTGDYGRVPGDEGERPHSTPLGVHKRRRAYVGGEFVEIDPKYEKVLRNHSDQERGKTCQECLDVYRKRLELLRGGKGTS